MGRASHGKACPWEGLPMGKAFSLARLLRGKVSIHHMGLSSSHVLFPMTWGVFPLASPGLVSHWKGLSLESLPMGRASHGKAFPWEGLPMERASHWQGFSGARFLFITWACPHPMCCSPWHGGCFLWLLLGWFLIGKVCHWKGFPWGGLPMGRPSHGKGFSLARFLRGKVSIHHMGLSSSHVLFPMTWGVFPLASPGLVSHWKGLSLERLPMGRPSHGKAFPWEGLLIGKVPQGQGFYSSHGLVLIPCVVPHDLGGVSSGFSWAGFSLERFVIGKASHGEAFPWQGLPMGRPSHWQGSSGARFLFITWPCPHPMCCSPWPGGCFLWLLLGWFLIVRVCHWKG